MNWLDILVYVICIAAFFRGLKTGLIMQLTSLAGIILGVVFAGKIAGVIYPHIQGWFTESENLAVPFSYLIGFILILIVVGLIGRIIHSFVNAVLLGGINRVVGAISCLGKWILIMSIMLNLIVIFDTEKTVIKAEVREKSRTYPVLMDIARIIIPYLQIGHYSSPFTTPEQENSSSRPVFEEV